MTEIQAADPAASRPADAIKAEAQTAAAIETAATKNAAVEAAQQPPEPKQEPEQPATPEPAPKVKKLDDWAQARILEEAAQRREEARRRKELEEENRRLAADLAALRSGQQQQVSGEAVALTPPAAQMQLPLNPADYEAAVQREAARRHAEMQFNSDCNRVASEGKQAYPDFDDALRNLQVAGVMNEANIQAIIATGEAPRLIYELGSDPAEAARIFALHPQIAAVELGKRAAVKPAKAAAAPVSNAPAPIKPVDGSARTSAEPRDDDSDADYFAKRIAQRRARGR